MVRRRNTTTEILVTGIPAIDRKLKELGQKVGNRAARAGLMKGARLAAKEIKKSIPSRLKSVRAAIGHRVDQKTKNKTTQAKAGAAVGKRKSSAKRPKRSSKHGVGIGKENIHWWILGTKERKRRQVVGFRKGRAIKEKKGHGTGQSTGQMPPHPVIKRLNLRSILSAVEEGSTKAIQRELDKLAKK